MLTPIGEVTALNLEPATYGCGASSALMQAGLRYLRQLGVKEVFLWVVNANARARTLHGREGFTTSRDRST
jgi:mycothiol synthase